MPAKWIASMLNSMASLGDFIASIPLFALSSLQDKA